MRATKLISANQATSFEHLAQMQALPLATSGTLFITSVVKTASRHQQRSGFVPGNFAFSTAQTLGSWQMGQRVGSMLFMYFFEVYLPRYKFTSIPFAVFAIGRKGLQLVLKAPAVLMLR